MIRKRIATRIGGKPLQIAGASLQQMDLRTIARPFLEDLAEETCLAIHLGVLNEIFRHLYR